MFTGLVETTGMVFNVTDGTFDISVLWEPETLSLGASVSCDGCCLTITSIRPWNPGGSRFTVDVSNETLSKTTLGDWRKGRYINLERSLRVGDELGGHLVAGHVDGVAVIENVVSSGFSKVFTVQAPSNLAKFLAPKGSVTLDGISLTVNEVDGPVFTLNLIPTTLSATTWGERTAGERVNMEVDLIARYVARLLGK